MRDPGPPKGLLAKQDVVFSIFRPPISPCQKNKKIEARNKKFEVARQRRNIRFESQIIRFDSLIMRYDEFRGVGNGRDTFQPSCSASLTASDPGGAHAEHVTAELKLNGRRFSLSFGSVLHVDGLDAAAPPCRKAEVDGRRPVRPRTYCGSDRFTPRFCINSS